MKLARTGWFALAAAALCGVWVLWARSPEQEGLAYHLSIGERLAYRLEFRSNGSADLRPLLEDANAEGAQNRDFSGFVQSFATSLKCVLTSTLLDKDDQGNRTVCYKLREAAVELYAGGQRSAPQEERLRRDGALDVFASLDKRGLIRTVRFDSSVDSASQAFIRALLGEIQVVLPEAQRQEAPAWDVEEEDVSGRYLARYQIEPGATTGTAGCKSISKSKVNYLTNPAPSGGARSASRRYVKRDDRQVNPEVIPNTDLHACVDQKAGRLVSLKGSDKQETKIGHKVIGRSETFLSLELDSVETIGEPAVAALREANAASLRSAKALPLSSALTGEEIKVMTRRGTLGNSTLEGLLAEVATQEARGKKEDTALYLKFRALASLKPETAATLGKVLAQADAGSLTFGVLSDALGEVGSAEAQAALVAAIRARREDWRALLRLIPPLGLTENPSSQTEEVLRELAFRASDENVTSTAQLALGNMVRRLAETSPERAERVVDAFVERATTTSSNADIEQLLLVLGNAGLARSLPLVARFLVDQSPTLRAAAASALRFVESDKANELLVKALESDSDEKVRQAAAYALSFREMTSASFAAQKRALTSEASEDVRLAVLGNLWSAREEFPEVNELVKRVSIEDRSTTVRNVASAMISKGSSS